MSSHTPGSWRVNRDHSTFQVIGPDGNLLADTLTLTRHADECEANAVLIAATVELYDALKGWLPIAERLFRTVPTAADSVAWNHALARIESSRKAIAKAEGKQA